MLQRDGIEEGDTAQVAGGGSGTAQAVVPDPDSTKTTVLVRSKPKTDLDSTKKALSVRFEG